MTQSVDPDTVRDAVRARYGSIAASVASSATSEIPVVDSGCCDDSCCGSASKVRSITSDLYAVDEVSELPSAAVLASLGCGNPTALAELHPGEVVLDLGSGGGIDVLLSARRVGATGFAYGLDMTDEMLALARRNAESAGVKNVSFLKGEIESIPLPDDAVDVVISNCVINLSADKARVLREAFRVLKPGGRFAVSDIVVQGSLTPAIRQSMELWAGCIAGALEEDEYRRLLAEAGFDTIGVQVTRVYDAREDSPDLAEKQPEALAEFEATGGRLVSAFVRAAKPRTAA